MGRKTIEIGYHIKDGKRDLTILDDRKRDADSYYVYEYLYHCNICGNEDWTTYSRLMTRKSNCNCCEGRKIIPGTNDITTTDPWMVKYFQEGIEEASKYTSKSGRKFYPKCPDCGYVSKKQLVISNVHMQHGFKCPKCGDGISYPNKYSREFLSQLPINNFIPEYTSEWTEKYLYDNYFEYKDKRYILEMDGGWHFKDNNLCNKTLEEIQRDDDYKNMIAKNNGVHIIRINCKESSGEYIKNNILNSELNNMFDLSNVDWDKCDKNAQKNIVKELCEYWEAYRPLYSELKQKFKIKGTTTITRYLKKGTEFGWCNYSKEQSHKIASESNKSNFNVYDTKGNVVLSYSGVCDFGAKSVELIGVKINHKKVSDILNNKTKEKYYKGYTFSYIN